MDYDMIDFLARAIKLRVGEPKEIMLTVDGGGDRALTEKLRVTFCCQVQPTSPESSSSNLDILRDVLFEVEV